MKKHLLLFGLAMSLFVGNSFSQVSTDCTGNRYKQAIFSEVESTLDVKYGSNIGQTGSSKDLFADIYYPAGDTDTDRPLIIVAHGGSFLGGARTDLSALCIEYAKMGYVAATISYRLIENPLDPDFLTNKETGFKRQVVHAIHDMKAAIRFFRKSVDNGNPYGINPNIIIAGGMSAGSIIANHVGYMDELSKVPNDLLDFVNENGGLEGNSGNSGYSSEAQLIVSSCGAILDTAWINPGSQPHIGFHNLDDTTVPNLHASPVISMGLGSITIEVPLMGDSLIHVRALNMNVDSYYKSYTTSGHCNYPTSEVINLSAEFIYDQICNKHLSLTKNDNTVYFSVYPNPAESSFFVDVPGNHSDWTVSVVNMLGQTVYNTSIDSFSNRIEIQTADFNAGVYMVNLISQDGKRATKRVVVQ